MEHIWSQPSVEPAEHAISTLVERSRADSAFEDVYIAVELAFQGMGAWVNRSRSYAGEPPDVSLLIPHEQSENMEKFSNRPA